MTGEKEQGIVWSRPFWQDHRFLCYNLSNRKALAIFNALKSMCNYYLQRGFQIVFIKVNSEFALLEVWMAMVYGAPELNLASANKNVPKIEQKI